LREVFFVRGDTIDVGKFNSEFPVRFSFSGNALKISTHLLGCQGNKRLNRCDGTGMTELGRLEKVELQSNEGPPPPLFVH
jgi:hypothetical protein